MNLSFISDYIPDSWTKKNGANNRPTEKCLVIDSQAKDSFIIIPLELINQIFSDLNPHELGMSSRVSKKWNQFASNPILWQSAIYRYAFSSKDWAELDADLVKDVDIQQEMLSLPENIAEELRHSAFPGKSIRETHVLVRMPKGLTINKLGELAKKYFFPYNSNGYHYIWPPIVEELGDKSADESIWLLMTKSILEQSKGIHYSKQKAMVAKLAETTKTPYQIPTTLEAATCILAEYSRSKNRPKNRLFSDAPSTLTRCQENVQNLHQIVVGNFGPAGLDVSMDGYDNENVGIAALRKFKVIGS